ncbi:MAG TPA: hypothetical protein VF198_14390 [Vicinamibacterales bacterium]
MAFAIAVGAVVSAQHPAPTNGRDQRPLFRAATDAVLVDVVVRDREGRPVTDLTVDDFEIFESRGTRPDLIRPRARCRRGRDLIRPDRPRDSAGET